MCSSLPRQSWDNALHNNHFSYYSSIEKPPMAVARRCPSFKRLPLTWGAQLRERERWENKTKVTCLVPCSKLTAVWFTLTLPSVTCLIGEHGQTQEKAFILVSPDLFLLWEPAGGCQTAASTDVKVFSRYPRETKKNLCLILILIFVHLAQRGTPSVPLAEATYQKLSTVK